MSFSDGVVSMARNTLSAVKLVRSGRWSLDDLEKWLEAVITDDPAHAMAVWKQMIREKH